MDDNNNYSIFKAASDSEITLEIREVDLFSFKHGENEERLSQFGSSQLGSGRRSGSGEGLSACVPVAGHDASCRTANASQASKPFSEEEQTRPCDPQR